LVCLPWLDRRPAAIPYYRLRNLRIELTDVLTATGTSPHEPAGGFAAFFRNVLSGLPNENRALDTSAGPLRLTYFHNLRWDGRTLAEAEKPFIRRDFTTFLAYKSFLDESMELFAANAGSQARQFPRRLMAALSAGYDSSTVAAIARPFGLDEVVLSIPTERTCESSTRDVRIAARLLLRTAAGT
jgi:hypothetical protein